MNIHEYLAVHLEGQEEYLKDRHPYSEGRHLLYATIIEVFTTIVRSS